MTDIFDLILSVAITCQHIYFHCLLPSLLLLCLNKGYLNCLEEKKISNRKNKFRMSALPQQTINGACGGNRASTVHKNICLSWWKFLHCLSFPVMAILSSWHFTLLCFSCYSFSELYCSFSRFIWKCMLICVWSVRVSFETSFHTVYFIVHWMLSGSSIIWE